MSGQAYTVSGSRTPLFIEYPLADLVSTHRLVERTRWTVLVLSPEPTTVLATCG